MADTMSIMILDAYAQALLAAKTKGLTGDSAKNAAYSAVARVVTKQAGRAVSPAEVQAIVTDHH